MAGIHLHQITQPGQQAAGVGFEQPFEMLDAATSASNACCACSASCARM
jgi:hypothetical protein